MSLPLIPTGFPRRSLILSLASLSAWPLNALCAPVAAPRLTFVALRNGSRIGQQQTSFERRGDELIVHSVAEFTVKLGPVPLYRYRHEATERWNAGAFASLESRTEQNGRTSRVAAESRPASVSIIGATGTRIAAPSDAVPFSHWNRGVAGRPMFNPQDGKVLLLQASAPHPASTLLANGTRIPTTRIIFKGDAEIQDDYDDTGTWAGLVGKLNDGSTLGYRRA